MDSLKERGFQAVLDAGCIVVSMEAALVNQQDFLKACTELDIKPSPGGSGGSVEGDCDSENFQQWLDARGR